MGDCLSVICIRNDASADSFFKVLQIIGETENCHHFRRNGNDKTVFSFNTVSLFLLTDCNGSECSVIHIQTSLPDNLCRIDIQRISLINGVVQHSRNQIVCGCDCMHITGKMKINGFHRNNLSVSAACCAPFETEYRAE